MRPVTTIEKNHRMHHQMPSYDRHTLRVLEFDQVREIVASFARSEDGREHLLTLEPSPDAPSARKLLAEAGECLRAVQFDDPPPSIAAPNLRTIFPRLNVTGIILEIEEIAASALSFETAGAVLDYLSTRREKYPLIAAISDALARNDALVRDIRRAIAPDLTITDDASPELKSIRRRLNRARSMLREMVEKKLGQLADDIVSERTVTVRDGRYVIPVRDGMKRQVPGAVHDRSQTGRTLFIEPLEAIEGNNEIRELELAEHAEIARILASFSKRITESGDDLERNQETLIRLDIIFAKARYGAAAGCVIPELSNTTNLVIRKGRHPLLDWKLRQRGTQSDVVPLDLAIGDDTHTMIITGPNAGGKTVAMKTAGLLILMALSGIPVPSGLDTILYAPPAIFADIGDEQSIADDLSTFSSHMKHIVAIIRGAVPGALAILDELGGGTNPADGEAIALAILKRLASSGAITLASSHHDGLKLYAHSTPGVMNASMEFDQKDQRPTFVLRSGVPGSSYAFEIAARMGMPQDVLADAEAIGGGERKSMAGLIAELEEQVRRTAREADAAAAERSQFETLRVNYESRMAELTSKKNDLMTAALDESKQIVADANRRIEATIRELRDKSASHEAIVAAKTAVRETADTLTEKTAHIPVKQEKKPRKPVTTLAAGQHVWITTMDAPGVVEEVLGAKVRVRAGSSAAALVVDRRNLAETPAPENKPQTVVVSSPSKSIDSLELDLRGMTFDEARDELDRFLSDMSSSGMETARIIHGKGTGALRKKITAYLDRHHAVASHRLGNWNEGSYGVTVVTLRG
jgi:DNA mismatch repair protein MutS2